MYRFLLTPRWLGAAALAVAAAVIMVMLGRWQLHRYEERTEINNRIDAADSVRAVPLTGVMTAPATAGRAGVSPGKRVAWTKVTVSGRYDATREIQARGRTVDGDVGFEIVTPLLLPDGTAVLIDRGWVPAPDAGALAAPIVPPAPTGDVTVVGQIHLSESRPTAVAHRNGRLDTRRISLPRLAQGMPYPVYGAYVLLTSQTPTADPAFTQIPVDHEDSWQNAGYTVQWWLFAAMALFAYGFQARKEAEARATPEAQPDPAQPDPALAGRQARPREKLRDRVAEADRRREEARRAPVDRVEEADRRREKAQTEARQAPADRAAKADRHHEETRNETRQTPADREAKADRHHEEAPVEARRGQADRVEGADRRSEEALIEARRVAVDRVEEADRKREAALQAAHANASSPAGGSRGGDVPAEPPVAGSGGHD